jgi:hypothetical protein
MATRETMSLAAQHALQDMVKLKMYLLSQPQQTPWLLLSRMRTDSFELMIGRPHSASLEVSAVNELLDLAFIEATSNRTFVVSKSGLQFYERKTSGTSPSPE